MPLAYAERVPRLYFLVSPRKMTGVTTKVLSEDFTGRLPISLVKAGHLSAGDNTVVQLAAPVTVQYWTVHQPGVRN